MANGRNKEVWKSIKNYEGLYEVSSFGRVKSCRRNKVMSLTKKPNGYLKVNLVKNKVWKTFSVHRLVALNFIDNKSKDDVVNHKDFNRSNNLVSNLEWVSHYENVQHAKRNNRFGNTRLFGSSNGRALFNSEEVLIIRDRLNSESISEISNDLGCRYNVICDIKNNKTYNNE